MWIGLWPKHTNISFSNGDDEGLIIIMSNKRPYFAQNETEINKLYNDIFNQLKKSEDKAKKIPSIKEYNFELDRFSNYYEPIFISQERLLVEKDGNLLKCIVENMIYHCDNNQTCDVSIFLISGIETFDKNMKKYDQVKKSLKSHSMK